MVLNRSLLCLFVLSAGLFMAGCVSMPRFGSPYGGNVSYNPSPHVAQPVSGKRKVGKPYTIMGKWYYPIDSSEGYRKKGIASWYGDEFHGKPTANGEVYNMYAFTAAHTTLPLPTYVRVTNLENGRHIKVKVNDRGPFLRGRLIDMSYAGARALGFAEDGTAPVLVEAYPTDGSPLRAPSARFAEAEPARAKQPVREKPAAKGSGFTYRISQRQEQQATQPDTPLPEEETATVKVPIYVQTGAFSDKANANRQKSAIADLYNNTRVMQTVVDGQTFHRVRIGPLDSVDIADQVLARLIHAGYKEAIIVVD